MGLLIALMLVLTGCGSTKDGDAADLGDLSGYVRVPEKPLGPATQAVTQIDGSSWRYDATEPGRITLLYFGYTSCPDVCPTTLADLAAALGGLPKKVRDRVDVQLVSTDPARDTPEQMRSWLAGFDPTFRGAHAPIDQVVAAARAYGISIEPPAQSDGAYEVSHGAQLLVLEPGGGAVGYFRELAGAKDYRKALPALVDAYARS